MLNEEIITKLKEIDDKCAINLYGSVKTILKAFPKLASWVEEVNHGLAERTIEIKENGIKYSVNILSFVPDDQFYILSPNNLDSPIISRPEMLKDRDIELNNRVHAYNSFIKSEFDPTKV